MNVDESDVSSSGGDDNRTRGRAAQHKRTRHRACVACRDSKTKCITVPGQSVCRACSKNSRACVVPDAVKPRARTSHRVSELEKKIQRLTNALLARNEPTFPAASSLPATHESSSVYDDDDVNRLTTSQTPLMPFSLPVSTNDTGYRDLIDRRVLQPDAADILFDHWRHRMSNYIPAVSLSEDVEAHNVRSTRPLLFLAVLVVASASVQPSLLPKLLSELNQQLTFRILVSGEKSLDLVQAIIIYVSHFVVPANAKGTSYTQYVHNAVSVALDLGLDKRSRCEPLRPISESDDIERTWLLCYYIASSVATLFRHTPLLRYTSYVEHCERRLSNKKEDLGIMRLCHLVRLQKITEEALIAFELEDPTSNIVFHDARTQFQLTTFERQLKAWQDNFRGSTTDGVSEHIMASATLYIHEVAIRSYQQALKTDKSHLAISSAAHFEALRVCLGACHTVINQYCTFTIAIARCLPDIFLHWTLYAAVMLIRLSHFIHTVPGMAQPPERSTIRLLEAVIARLSESSKNGYWPPAKEALVLFERLRVWYLYKKVKCQRGDPACNLVDGGPSVDDISRTLDGGSYGTQIANPSDNMLGIDQGAPHNPDGQVGVPSTFDDAAIYDDIDWNSITFNPIEMNAFDMYMQDGQWMSCLYDRQQSWDNIG